MSALGHNVLLLHVGLMVRSGKNQVGICAVVERNFLFIISVHITHPLIVTHLKNNNFSNYCGIICTFLNYSIKMGQFHNSKNIGPIK